MRRLFALAALTLFAAACATAPSSPPAWRFGVAAFDRVEPIAAAPSLRAASFDYLEPALGKLATASDAEVAAARASVIAGGVPVEAMNWFLPGATIPVVGPAVDAARQDEYLRRALPLAASFGARVVVFGSPAARTRPDGFARDEAERQLVAFLRRCADVIAARELDLVVAIEPLRRPETNTINSLAEALALWRAVDRPQVGVVVDVFHLAFEGEDPAVVAGAGKAIVHAQAAAIEPRGWPRAGDDAARYAPYLAALRQAGYRGRVSVEAPSDDVARDAGPALARLRALLE